MIRRHSAARLSICALAKSRSATARRLAISCGLVLCSLIQPCATQFCKLTLVSHNEQFWALQYARDEMMLLQNLFAKLGNWVHSGVNLSRPLLLRGSQGLNNLTERGITDYKHVQVAASTLFCAGR